MTLKTRVVQGNKLVISGKITNYTADKTNVQDPQCYIFKLHGVFLCSGPIKTFTKWLKKEEEKNKKKNL